MHVLRLYVYESEEAIVLFKFLRQEELIIETIKNFLVSKNKFNQIKNCFLFQKIFNFYILHVLNLCTEYMQEKNNIK